MIVVASVLDRSPPGDDAVLRRAWRAEVERSLAEQPDEWCREVGPVPYYGLAQERAWVLLSWVEDMASLVVVERRPELVERIAFAMSLLEASPLDRRDVMVVAMLVRRASNLVGCRSRPSSRADAHGPVRSVHGVNRGSCRSAP